MRSSILLVSGLAAAQAFCPAPAASGVLSLRAQADSVSRRNVLAGVLGGASVAALNIFAPAEADAVGAHSSWALHSSWICARSIALGTDFTP
jgi:hypothetical protein